MFIGLAEQPFVKEPFIKDQCIEYGTINSCIIRPHRNTSEM